MCLDRTVVVSWKDHVMAPSLRQRDNLTAVETTAVRDLLGRMGLDAAAEDVVAELARAGVDVSEEHVEQIKAQLAAGAARWPSIPATATQAPPEWHEQEQTAEPTNMQAQRLVEQAGSPEMAKQAIDTVAARAQQGSKADPRDPARSADSYEQRKTQLAEQLGYASYLELFEASTPVPTQDGKAWCVTSDHRGSWVIWNDEELEARGGAATKQDAMATILQR
jgi:hypothetical protein